MLILRARLLQAWGWRGPDFCRAFNPISTVRQIMPTTVICALPNIPTLRRPWIRYKDIANFYLWVLTPPPPLPYSYLPMSIRSCKKNLDAWEDSVKTSHFFRDQFSVFFKGTVPFLMWKEWRNNYFYDFFLLFKKHIC